MSKRTKNDKPTRLQSALRRVARLRTGILAGVCLLLAGIFVVGYQFISVWHSQQTSAETVPLSEILNTAGDNNKKPYVSGKPVSISIPSRGIELKVLPGVYNPDNASWSLSLDSAHWGVMTQKANDRSGMTFIYGHYRRGVFVNLPKIEAGEKAVIETDNGYKFTYKFRAATITTPTDTSIFSYSGDPILMLQTCTGVRFENRQLFAFDLVSVE